MLSHWWIAKTFFVVYMHYDRLNSKSKNSSIFNFEHVNNFSYLHILCVNLLILIILGGGKLHADQTQSSALKINTTGGQADGQHLSSSSTSIGSSTTAPTSSSSSHKHSSSGSSASKSASKSAGKGSSSSESKSSKSESHHHRSSSHHSSSKSKSSQHERYYLYSCNKITKT